MEAEIRQVNVKTISGEIKVIEVPASMTIKDFREKVMEVFNVPVDRQRLICQGKLLKDEQVVNDYIKENGQTVHLMVRADVPETPPNQVPPQPAPNVPNAPLQFDQMISSMMNNLLSGQIFVPQGPGAAPRVNVNVSAQNVPMPGPHARVPQNEPNMPQNRPPPNVPQNHPHPNAPGPQPRNQVEFTLPFNHIHNIGAYVNEFHGAGASFPPPRMPQLPVQRNPLVLLGGFLYNYQFQLLRLLPFISRVADLLQRESLVTDPAEREMMQALAQRVGITLNELVLATNPITGLLQTLHIGPSPGQFQMRIGNLPISSEVHPHGHPHGHPHVPSPHVPGPQANVPHAPHIPPNPQASNPNVPGPQIPMPHAPQVPNPSPNVDPNLNPVPGSIPNLNIVGFQNLQFPFPGMVPNAPGQPNPFGNMFMQGQNSNQANMLTQIMPMFTQLLGGNQNMTLRELLNTLQMHDEEESLPMMEFFYNLNLAEIISFASGNWEVIERHRPAARENLLRLMEGDSPEGRSRIVQILVDYMQRQYGVPDQFASLINPSFSVKDSIKTIGEKWLLKLVSLVLDYEGDSFSLQFKNTIELMIGNYAEEMVNNTQGGIAKVIEIINTQMQISMARVIPPEFNGMISGVMGGILTAYVTKALNTFKEWKESNRTQEEAKEGPQSGAAGLLATWQETIQNDLLVPVPQQNPFSRAYLESDAFAAGSGAPSFQSFFANNLARAFGNAGVSPAPSSAPREVVQEFANNFLNAVRDRLQRDTDFRSGRFENLDKIHK